MCDEIDLQLGRRLRRRRRLLGLTQEQLGARCGVRFQQIQKYETATNRMSAGLIVRLAQALNVEPGYFYEGLVVSSEAQPRSRARARGRDDLGKARRVDDAPGSQEGGNAQAAP